MDHKVYGTFIKKDGCIYRTDTYIQFGESEEIIGACVLCNPGSANLKDSVVQQALEKSTVDLSIESEADEDPTIKQLVEILRKSYKTKIEGKFLILNLFTIKDGKMDDAVIKLGKSIHEKLLDNDFLILQKLETEIPWLLVGWGCEDKSILKGRKQKWLNYIERKGLVFTGIENGKKPHYYHIKPQGKSKKYIECIVPKIKHILATEGSLS